MLAPIPRRMLQSSAVFHVPTAIDGYQKPTAVTDYAVAHVHIQADDVTIRTSQNTEVQLRGTLFVDAKFSAPAYDYEALQQTAHAAGGVMTVTVTDRHGAASGPYTVLTVDGLPDDEDRLHHWELGLV